MGWTFYHKPVGVKAVDSIRDNCFYGEGEKNKIVAMTATREAVFVVYKSPGPSSIYEPDPDGSVRALLVFNISNRPKDDYNFGYKDMEEASGPYGCECPPGFLAKASALKPLTEEEKAKDGGLKWAHDYRKRCVDLFAAKALKRRLKVGDKVTTKNGAWAYTVARGRVRGHRGQTTYFYDNNGRPTLLAAHWLIGAKVEPAEERKAA